MNSCSACNSAPANLYCATRKFFVCVGCELKKTVSDGCHPAPDGQVCQLCEERAAICFCKNGMLPCQPTFAAAPIARSRCGLS